MFVLLRCRNQGRAGEARIIAAGRAASPSLHMDPGTLPNVPATREPIEWRTSARQRAPQAAHLTPKVVIPHHWDDYYPPLSRMNRVKQFEAAIKIVAPGIKVFVPAIGQKFHVAELL